MKAPGAGTMARVAGAIAERLAGAVERRPWTWVLASGALTALSLAGVVRLEVRSDLVELLPQDYQSVRDLRRITERLGGLGHLSLAVESADLRAAQRFMDDVAALFERDFGARLASVDYRIDAIKRFYAAHAPLYMELADLRAIQERVAARVAAERARANPLFVALDDEEDDEGDGASDELSFADLEAKYRSRTARWEHYLDGYYTGEGGRLLAMLLKPNCVSTDIPCTRALLGDLRAALERLAPANYAPDLRYTFGGSTVVGLEEFDILRRDIFGTAALCLSLISLVILLFYRRLRPVLLLGATCLVGVAWAFGLTWLAIGYLNLVTAFMGAIIAGTGINYGIILLARYFEERRLGQAASPALHVAMRQTVIGTFGAAATTAAAFGVFAISEIRSFSQFGFIGSVGVALIWLASYTLLPSLILLSERFWPSVGERAGATVLLSDRLSFGGLARLLERPRLVLAVFGVLTLAALGLFARYLPDSLEYDLNALRTKSSFTSGAARLTARLDRVFELSMTPAVVMVDDPEEGRAVCAVVQHVKERRGEASLIEACRSLYSFLPEQQEAKLAVLAEIRALLPPAVLERLPAQARQRAQQLLDGTPTRPLTITDLPAEATRLFKDRGGGTGGFVYVYPRHADRAKLSLADNLFSFTDDIRRLELPSGKVITTSGAHVVFADILRLIARDGPLATSISFLAVFALLLLTLGGLRPSLSVAAALLAGTSIMTGGIALAGVKLTFVNFVAFPMTFGISVDYALNVYQRYQLEGPGAMAKTLRRTGSAVVLCSLTTIIGYGTLLYADSNALVSLGSIAVLGEVACLAAAVIALPALVIVLERPGAAATARPGSAPADPGPAAPPRA